MGSNYTPQAGDVIESPSGNMRLRVTQHPSVPQLFEVWAFDSFYARWGKVGECGSQLLQNTVNQPKRDCLVIGCRGRIVNDWTLVFRKEVQDGKKR